MPVVCRLIELTPDQAASLLKAPATLTDVAAAAKLHSGVYRYWHGIAYLLRAHPKGSGAAPLGIGKEVSKQKDDTPGARLLSPDKVPAVNAIVQAIEPEGLIAHYDAAALDKAGVYPKCWVEWEETFDPLGQLLEHYHFYRMFAAQCAKAGDALLFYFEFDNDGTDS